MVRLCNVIYVVHNPALGRIQDPQIYYCIKIQIYYCIYYGTKIFSENFVSLEQIYLDQNSSDRLIS